MGSQLINVDLFRYPSLDLSRQEIRLVTLLPGDENGADPGIKCSLGTASLLDQPRYEALSYTWGNNLSRLSIQLNNSSFQVTENLASALSNLRDSVTPRVLWIDAICINQGDIRERNHQVQQMGAIYRNAFRVVVWIGESSQFSEHIFSSLNDDDVRKAREYGTLDKYRRDVIEHCMTNLSGREYWTRLWIIQEIGLASDIIVQCGTRSVGWTELSSWFGVGSLPYRLDTVRRDRQKGHCSLTQLMESFWDSQCQEPKDHIYGLLGVATDADVSAVPVDYSNSLFDMYADLVLWAAEHATTNTAHLGETIQKVLYPFGGVFSENQGSVHYEHLDKYSGREVCDIVSSVQSGDPTRGATIVKFMGQKIGNIMSVKRGRYSQIIISVSDESSSFQRSPPIEKSWLETTRSIRVYTRMISVAMETAVTPSQRRPRADLLVTNAEDPRLAAEEVIKCLENSKNHRPSLGDIVFKFPGCSFVLVVQTDAQAGAIEPVPYGKAFIAKLRKPVLPQQFAAKLRYSELTRTGVVQYFPDLPPEYVCEDTWFETDGAEVQFEADLLSFQRMTNQETPYDG